MYKKQIMLVIFCLLLVGCNNLKTNQKEWEDCRGEAWNKCHGSDGGKKISDFLNNNCVYNPSKVGCDMHMEINNIMSNCWINYAEDCDNQFDMKKIETANLSIEVEIVHN